MNLFHRTHPTAALGCLAQCFMDSDFSYDSEHGHMRLGVWLCDKPIPPNEIETAQLAVELRGPDVADFERKEDEIGRWWLVPSELLNRIAENAHLVEDDGKWATPATVERIERGTPPAHVARIYADLGIAQAKRATLAIMIAIRSEEATEGILAEHVNELLSGDPPPAARANLLEGFCYELQKYLETAMKDGGTMPENLAENTLFVDGK